MLSAFFAQVRGSSRGERAGLRVDLAAVAYVDSAAIGCLMDIRRLLEARGGVLGLSGLQWRVETMLAMTGLLRLLEFQTADAAGRRRPWVPAAPPRPAPSLDMSPSG
jgi:anti-anti-sigma factor